MENGLLKQKPFAYSQTRMVPIKAFCDLLEKRLTEMPDYCVYSFAQT